MKKLILAAACVLTAGIAAAQTAPAAKPAYTFTTVREMPVTSIKNQASSGTCWAFSTISFLESEIIRINGIKDPAKYPDLSEFFIVSHSYVDRAEKYIRLDGRLGFSAGSEADDVLHVIRDYGIVPDSEMTGMNYGTELPAQSELDAVLAAYVGAVNKVPNRTLTTAWKRGFQGIVDAYLGAYPSTFMVDGREYTPESYRDALKLNVDDYVTITSFTHHPFYTKFALELPDNWRWDEAYNLPIDEFMQCIDYALENGYTLAWGTDVSETGFTRTGVATLPDTKAAAAPGSDQEHWVGKADEKAPVPAAPKEIVPTQEYRQQGFDNKSTTDDHGMHIYGIAKDQYGNKFYMVKNSWGETGTYKGMWYASENFVAGKSMDVMLHKNALPKDIRKKLGI